MPSLTIPELTIRTDRPADEAAITVSCDVEFTKFEVNAMNRLGLRYELSCRVLNKGLFDDDQVVTFDTRIFPRVPRMASAHEHVVFGTVEGAEVLHDLRLGNDKLVAEIRLRNLETDETQSVRSEVMEGDLAA